MEQNQPPKEKRTPKPMETLENSPITTSPRRALSPEEKTDRDEAYKEDLKNFSNLLRDFVHAFNALSALSAALGQAKKGGYLAYPHPTQKGAYIPFRRKDLKSANAKFGRAIMDLKNYVRAARKKTRGPSSPESFSGTFSPVQCLEALLYFFNTAPERFGPLAPRQAMETQQSGPSLMESLPLVKQGYALRNTITMLFYVYAHANDLQLEENRQLARSDHIMMEAFGGKIHAAYYSYKVKKPNPRGKVPPPTRIVKMPMDDAVATGKIPRRLNTYEVIAKSYPPGTKDSKDRDIHFDPNRFYSFFYQNMAASNYNSKAILAADPSLAEIRDFLAREDVRAAMLDEHTIVKSVSAEWSDVLEPERKRQRDARKKASDAAKRANAAAERAAERAAAGRPNFV